MPELPDLEVIKAKLAPQIIGKQIIKATLRQPIILRMPLPGNFADYLIGYQFKNIERRGKNLIFTLDSGNTMVMNLMLTGRLQYCASHERIKGDTYIIFSFAYGMDLRFIDPKKMGKVYLVKNQDFSIIPSLQNLGPEPLTDEFTLEKFQNCLKRRQAAIKTLLCKGECVAGIGNAYADEILFDARIHPKKRATSIPPEGVQNLYFAIKNILKQAIAQITSKIGENIHYEVRDFLKVHGRRRLPCPECGTRIARIMVGMRETHYCPQCQKK